MSFIKSVSRKIIFPALLSVKAEKLLSSFTKNNLLILNYHGVVKETNFSLSKNHLSVEQFDSHLNYFRNNFNVVSLSEIFKSRKNPIATKEKTIAITFDDGYENNYTNAFPLLRQYSFPATIFITSQALHQPDEALWYDQIDILRGLKSYEDISDIVSGIFTAVKLNSFDELKKHLKKLNSSEKKNFFRTINSKFGKIIYSQNPEYWKLLSRDQIKEMSASPLIEIGSHGLTHSNLDCLNEQLLNIELTESKRLLEEVTNKEIHSIAYPDGAYNENVKWMSINSGYNQLLAVDLRLNSDKRDKNILPRLSISNTTTYESVMISIHRGFNLAGI